MSLALLTLAVSIAGGLLFLRLRVPGGAMLGAILAAALLNLATGQAYVPSQLSVLAKLTTGAFIGAQIRKKDLLELKKVLLPTVTMIVAFFLYNVLCGCVLHRFAALDMLTALFATAPGGTIDMTLIGEELGANAAVIAAVQSCRLIVICTVTPFAIKAVIQALDRRAGHRGGDAVQCDDAQVPEQAKPRLTSKDKARRTGITLAIAFAAGMLGYAAGIPAGTITGALLATAIYNVRTEKAYMPVGIRRTLLMVSGALVGARITMHDLRIVKELLGPMLVILSGYLVLNVLLGIWMYRRHGFSLSTALFATAPGGMTEMLLVAGDVGADMPKTAVMQLSRNIVVVSVFPLLIAQLFAP